MEQGFIVAAVGVFGLLFGSFAGATVWRLRARQLVEDLAEGEVVDKKELKMLKPLTAASLKDDRSRCLRCGHHLEWYDLLPLFSWLQLGGKCRYCHVRIGWFEPAIELATAAVFVVSYLAWPHELADPMAIVQFCVWLCALVGLIILFCYDLRWYLLPDKIMFPVMGIASIYALLVTVSSPSPLAAFTSLCFAIGVLSGLYYVLYFVSKGAWVGFGDIKLGLALALLLGEWPLALLTLFLANVIGCSIVLPAMLVKKIGRYSRVPFGPMLIGAWWIATMWGGAAITWYMSVSFMT